MKQIPLGRSGEYTLVDDEDYEALSQFKWYSDGGYAYKAVNKGVRPLKSPTRVYMHRILSGVCGDKSRHVDHINRNPLDNRRENLRICVHAENMRNCRQYGKSGFKGVFAVRPKEGRAWPNPWYAKICVRGKQHCLGSFPTKEEAAKAYDTAALEHFGKFACTNKMLGLI